MTPADFRGDLRQRRAASVLNVTVTRIAGVRVWGYPLVTAQIITNRVRGLYSNPPPERRKNKAIEAGPLVRSGGRDKAEEGGTGDPASQCGVVVIIVIVSYALPLVPL